MKIKTTLKEFLNENKKVEFTIDDIVDKKIDIEYGNTGWVGVWDKDTIIEKIRLVLQHNLFDSDFYYNWTDYKNEYNKIFSEQTIKPMLDNINETLNEYFILNTSTSPNMLKFKKINGTEWIDKWFQTNKFISKELKSDYYDYRKEYAGVTLQ